MSIMSYKVTVTSINKQDKLLTLKQIHAVKLGVFTAVQVQILVLCVMTLCCHTDGQQCFRETCCLHLQGRNTKMKIKTEVEVSSETYETGLHGVLTQKTYTKQMTLQFLSP
jgi:hypothetical protein